MTCQHENADDLMPGEWFNLNDVPQHIVAFRQFRCIDCGAWLSLGPSNDDVPGVERQLAREIADMCQLWEPGAHRESAIDNLVEFWSER